MKEKRGEEGEEDGVESKKMKGGGGVTTKSDRWCVCDGEEEK